MRTNIPDRRERGTSHLNNALGEISVPDAIDYAAVIWPQLAVFPCCSLPPALQALNDISVAATDHGVRTLAELTGPAAAAVLASLADVADPTAFQTPGRADSLHFYRNLITAMRATVALSLDGNDLAVGDLADGLPRLQPRSLLASRPLTDDEAALHRLDAEREASLGGSQVAGTVAAMLSGQYVREVGVTLIRHLDDDALHSPGCNAVQARTIPLLPWETNMLQRVADAREAVGAGPDATLVFTGALTSRGKGGAASSFDGILKRVRERTGLAAPDLTATSAALWRPHFLLAEHNDLQGALEVSGRKPELLLRALHLYIDTDDDHRGTVILRNVHGEAVATPRVQDLPPRDRRGRGTDSCGEE